MGIKTVSDGRFHLDLVVTDQEVITELGRVAESEQRAYALSALRIGVLALRSARGEVDATAVKEQLASALNELKMQLTAYKGTLDTVLVNHLSQYTSRSEANTSGMESMLNRIMEEYRRDLLTGIDRHIQATAEPLLKVMNPESSVGILALMGDTVRKALKEMSDRIKQEVLSQFSRDSSGSAMSRLEELIKASQSAITRQFSMDDRDSALYRLDHRLGTDIKALADQQTEFQAEVRATLSALAAKKQAEAQSTTHGFAYEEAVITALGPIVHNHGHILEACGNTVGTIRSCKTGDALTTLGADCVAPGEKIVIEAKSAMGYDTQKILGECEQARKNREAQVCIFVIDTPYAPASLTAPFTRHGDTIVVKWAQEDNDAYLRAAFSLACALVVRRAKSVQASAVDWSKMEKAALEVQKRAESLADITTWTTSIVGAANKILDRVRIAGESLASQVETLMDQIKGLKGGE